MPAIRTSEIPRATVRPIQRQAVIPSTGRRAQPGSVSTIAPIVARASVREMERTLNKSIDPLRFRANVYIDMDEPWAEFKWIGKDIEMGSAGLHVFARTSRCAATNVDPDTGVRDMAIPAMLTRAYGHEDFGVYATVSTGGVIKTGDSVGVAD